MSTKWYLPVVVAACLSVAACGSDSSDEEGEEHGRAEDRGKSSSPAQPSVKPTGNAIEVKMITDTKGERYDPTDITVERGDSLRFLLASGVHNVHFVAAKNPVDVKLPPASEYLQLPGQKLTYLMDFPEGRYYYQCDIHVALGMFGHVNVGDDR